MLALVKIIDVAIWGVPVVSIFEITFPAVKALANTPPKEIVEGLGKSAPVISR